MSRIKKLPAPAVVTHGLLVPEHIERQRSQWQFRAVEATKGNQTHIGRILLAALGKEPQNAPRFSLKTGCVILNSAMADRLGLEEGDILADYQAANDEPYQAMRVCNVAELRENFSRLSDHLKLTTAEREAMFMCLRQWVQKDYTATSSTEQGERGETDEVQH
jgi:hypothetical protein